MFCDISIYFYIITNASPVIAENPAVSPFFRVSGEKQGKIWQHRVKNIQTAGITEIQFVKTLQFEKKDLQFEVKNDIMTICICGIAQKYAFCWRQPMPSAAQGRVHNLYIKERFE